MESNISTKRRERERGGEGRREEETGPSREGMGGRTKRLWGGQIRGPRRWCL